MGNPKTQKEILDAIDIIVSKRMNGIAKILFGTVVGLGEQNFCTININGATHKIRYYGNVLPDNNKKYPLFVPSSGMSQAFIITGVSSGGGGSGGDGVVYTPSISNEGIISWTNNGGLPNPSPVNIKGVNGATFTPSVSNEGIISWTNNGNLDNPSPVNIKGPQGVQGVQGEQGIQGATGPQGEKGDTGATFTPTVSAAGVISWTNNGGLPNPSPVDIKGPQGDDYVLTEEDKEEIASMIPDGGSAEKYQVGDIFITTRSGNPNSLLGYGTWSQIKDRFLLAAGDTYTAGSIGGEAAHKLTESELPALEGSFQARGWNGTPNMLLNPSGIVSQTVQSGTAYGAESDGTQIGYKTTTISFGDDQSHNNMPPYLSVYMWLRTA